MNIFPFMIVVFIGCLAICGVSLTMTFTLLEIKKLVKKYNEDAE